MRNTDLVAAAKKLVHPRTLNNSVSIGGTGCALQTVSGNVYTGISMDCDCGLGTCAEHAAVTEMLKGGETHIRNIVAISQKGIVPPCGRCRELMLQIDRKNLDAKILLPKGSKSLRILLPVPWKE